ncbi:hypothetical protein B0T16DRAFT_452692 [Cercophora newfieldiana]|uniref:2EXR domain-containing protein n=1 Tax=Cercophora newfieldiana TaxID=92897 RepID=A0AA39YTM5_9PEZI|nr:hypothetical protein B0T16DRAFT_452692 [Cercophora newfieldiana]
MISANKYPQIAAHSGTTLNCTSRTTHLNLAAAPLTCSTKMAPKTFHPFPWLPPELRDMIWDFAIRPDRPGVHFFTILDDWVESDEDAMKYHTLQPASESTTLAMAYGEGAASDPHNYSTSLIDSGL